MKQVVDTIPVKRGKRKIKIKWMEKLLDAGRGFNLGNYYIHQN